MMNHNLLSILAQLNALSEDDFVCFMKVLDLLAEKRQEQQQQQVPAAQEPTAVAKRQHIILNLENVSPSWMVVYSDVVRVVADHLSRYFEGYDCIGTIRAGEKYYFYCGGDETPALLEKALSQLQQTNKYKIGDAILSLVQIEERAA
jgi:hypothetical protein